MRPERTGSLTSSIASVASAVLVFVLRGIPGSGKSTFIEALLKELGIPRQSMLVCSADHFFMVDGEYRFDPAKLPAAHGACKRAFVEALQAAVRCQPGAPEVIVVDNTNLSAVEMAPYVEFGQAYGATVQVVTIECDPEVAQARNVHGVPAATYARMVPAFEAGTKAMLPWWPHRVVQQ